MDTHAQAAGSGPRPGLGELSRSLSVGIGEDDAMALRLGELPDVTQTQVHVFIVLSWGVLLTRRIPGRLISQAQLPG
ncbi:hypothetical protein ACGFNP_51100 [Nonomuraea sp. NPDC049269]|uniref:hypothetical protein n=1 Tax=Nonomuraea sp. NPDC049269 TaxID=3364349 RepID=UPI00371C8958